MLNSGGLFSKRVCLLAVIGVLCIRLAFLPDTERSIVHSESQSAPIF